MISFFLYVFLFHVWVVSPIWSILLISLYFYFFLGFYYGNFLEQRNWAHLFVPGILHSGGQLGLVKGAGVHTIPLWEWICEINKAVLLVEQIHRFFNHVFVVNFFSQVFLYL